MRDRLTRILVALAVTVSIGTSVRTQTFDSEAERLPGGVKMPAAVNGLLRKEDQVTRCASEGSPSPAWFLTAKVDLNGDRFADYVVRSNTGCLSGPRAASWWIFRGSRKGLEKVFDDSVLTLTIGGKRTAGFRDVQTETVMMSIIRNTWKFDGRKYRLRATRMVDPSK